jgi:hypothetical protein
MAVELLHNRLKNAREEEKKTLDIYISNVAAMYRELAENIPEGKHVELVTGKPGDVWISRKDITVTGSDGKRYTTNSPDRFESFVRNRMNKQADETTWPQISKLEFIDNVLGYAKGAAEQEHIELTGKYIYMNPSS